MSIWHIGNIIVYTYISLTSGSFALEHEQLYACNCGYENVSKTKMYQFEARMNGRETLAENMVRVQTAEILPSDMSIHKADNCGFLGGTQKETVTHWPETLLVAMIVPTGAYVGLNSLQLNLDGNFYQLRVVVERTQEADNPYAAHFVTYALVQSNWWLIDDAVVRCVDADRVMKARPYLMGYEKQPPNKLPTVPSTTDSKSAGEVAHEETWLKPAADATALQWPWHSTPQPVAQNLHLPLDEVVFANKRGVVDQSSIMSLRPGKWLNDEIINSVIGIFEDFLLPRVPQRVHIFNTFFYQELTEYVTYSNI